MIPCLLLSGSGLTKTKRFNNRRYVGDVINAVRIFNEKEVDELLVLDIDATVEGRGPQMAVIEQIAEECFMPLAYGGGIDSVECAKALFSAGVEKVVINSAAVTKPDLIAKLSSQFGSQSIVVCVDYKRDWLGRARIVIRAGRQRVPVSPEEHAKRMQACGAGELIIHSIERDGMRGGYDLETIGKIASVTSVPVIACGGAGQLADFKNAIDAGASAVAAGSMFVFHGRHQAVLITYPERNELESLFSSSR